MNWLTDPWAHTFMQNAFLASALVGIICGVAGTFVVLKGLAFMGDALAHAIFPGIVIAFIAGSNLLFGAIVSAVLVSLLIGFVSRHGRLQNDTAIGVLFVGAFALGIALMSTQKSFTKDLTSFLVGSILGVSRSDLYLTAAIGSLVIAVIALGRRELTAIAFDPIYATASGIRTNLHEQIFLVMLSLAIVVSIQTVGNILVLAMLVTPAATSRLLTERLVPMTLLSAIIGGLSGIGGLYLSYHYAISSGASIVLVATAFFLLVFLFSPKTGVIAVPVRQRLHFPYPERDSFPDTSGQTRD